MLGKAIKTGRLTVLMLEAGAVLFLIFGGMMMMTDARGVMDDVAGDLMERNRLDRGEVAIGGNTKALEKAHIELTSKAAFLGEAARNSDRLQVGIVSFRNAPRDNSVAFFPVTLNVRKLSRAGVLLIADGPTHWTIANARSDQRAKLAFEGKSPVQVSSLPHGFLAGTRIKPFDAKYVSGVDSWKTEKGQFCDTMNVWADFFEIPLEEISVGKVVIDLENPRLTASDRGFKTAGSKTVKPTSAKSICSSRS